MTKLQVVVIFSSSPGPWVHCHFGCFLSYPILFWFGFICVVFVIVFVFATVFAFVSICLFIFLCFFFFPFSYQVLLTQIITIVPQMSGEQVPETVERKGNMSDHLKKALSLIL